MIGRRKTVTYRPPSETHPQYAAIFKRLDHDGSGSLTLKELAAALRSDEDFAKLTGAPTTLPALAATAVASHVLEASDGGRVAEGQVEARIDAESGPHRGRRRAALDAGHGMVDVAARATKDDGIARFELDGACALLAALPRPIVADAKGAPARPRFKLCRSVSSRQQGLVSSSSCDGVRVAE